jgi:hypothetical protein
MKSEYAPGGTPRKRYSPVGSVRTDHEGVVPSSERVTTADAIGCPVVASTTVPRTCARATQGHSSAQASATIAASRRLEGRDDDGVLVRDMST